MADHNGFNVKLVNMFGEDGGRWIVRPENRAMVAYINSELKSYQAEEPAVDWHLQTCGTVVGYHRVDGSLLL